MARTLEIFSDENTERGLENSKPRGRRLTTERTAQQDGLPNPYCAACRSNISQNQSRQQHIQKHHSQPEEGRRWKIAETPRVAKKASFTMPTSADAKTPEMITGYTGEIDPYTEVYFAARSAEAENAMAESDPVRYGVDGYSGEIDPWTEIYLRDREMR